MINYSNSYFSSALFSFGILYLTFTLSPSFVIFFHFLLCYKLAHCYCLPASEWKDLTLFSSSFTPRVSHPLSLVHFPLILTFLLFPTYCSVHEWLGYLIRPPVPLPAGLKINRVVVWQCSSPPMGCRRHIYCGHCLLLQMLKNYAVHTAAPSLARAACSCHWKAGI